LQNGVLSIHRAWLWSKLPKLQQRVEFARYEEERTQRKILHEFLPKPASVSLDLAQVIEALQRLEARQPGSIAIRTSRRLRRTVVTLGQDFSRLPGAQKELDWHA
jgi:ADP-dependent phosphofructokinase/glucokinase